MREVSVRNCTCVLVNLVKLVRLYLRETDRGAFGVPALAGDGDVELVTARGGGHHELRRV